MATKLKTVHRVEHPSNGRGPYINDPDLKVHRLHKEHSGGAQHPSPRMDGIRTFDYQNDFCAMPTLSALDKWFEGFHEEMHIRGFHIATYEVPEDRIQHGKKQIVFNRKGLKPVFTRPLVGPRKRFTKSRREGVPPDTSGSVLDTLMNDLLKGKITPSN